MYIYFMAVLLLLFVYMIEVEDKLVVVLMLEV